MSFRGIVGILAASMVVQALAPGSASAWKPYTHFAIGDQVRADAIDDGRMTIESGPTTQRRTHTYAVDPRIVTALRQWPSYYNAGVVGPDGFPDITYGQAVIHPEHTGRWMRYVYREAWRAQRDPRYSPAERGQILAFAYGFMVHAAGDLWGHTLINGFAGGVFPSIGPMIRDLVLRRDPRRFDIALRHVVAEGYVGNATPGWDTFDGDDVPDATTPCRSLVVTPPDAVCQTAEEPVREELSQVCDARTAANPPSGTTCLVSGAFGARVPDISSNATPGVPLQAPTRFIYNAFIDPRAPTPGGRCADPAGAREGCPDGTYKLSTDAGGISVKRGPALDFFLDLEARLQVKSAKDNDRVRHNCLTDVPGTNCHFGSATIQIHTVRGSRAFGTGRWICSRNCVLDPSISVPAALRRDYARAWITDLEKGMRHWPDFSLAISRGLFDPQTRRDAENDSCQTTGPQNILNLLRDTCELKTGIGDAAFFAADHIYRSGEASWINRYLIPMAGFPDFVGDLRSISQKITGAITDVFAYLGLFNPLDAILANLKEYVVSKIENLIEESYGISVPAFEAFFHHPSQWFCGDDGSGTSLRIRGFTFTPAGIFSQSAHERMDGYMAIPSDHHAEAGGLPASCAPIRTDTKFERERFAAYRDSVTMSKLLLLDGVGLDHVVGDALRDDGEITSAESVKTFARTRDYDPTTNGGIFPANVMVDTLEAGRATATPKDHDVWLQLIDGDHAWRRDGLPRFCDVAGDSVCHPPPEISAYSVSPIGRPRPADDTSAAGGNGQFPMWASCLLRPAFRLLFVDWENDELTDPSHRNFPSLGDEAQPDASAASSALASASLTGTSFTAGGTTFIAGNSSFTVHVSDDVFTSGVLVAQFRTYHASDPAPPFSPGEAPFLRDGDTFRIVPGADDGPRNVEVRAQSPCVKFAASSPSVTQYFLDTTAPTVNATVPRDGARYTHSQSLTLDFSADDGAGSGVAATTATLDGASGVAGHGLQSGQRLDLLTELSLGDHTFKIKPTDNLGNTRSVALAFSVIVTPASIKEDVIRFFAAGRITKDSFERGLLERLDRAAERYAAGRCRDGQRVYNQFIERVGRERGRRVESGAADIMAADARYLIGHC